MEIYLDKLLGISCDKQCQDMVRSCGLAYDPDGANFLGAVGSTLWIDSFKLICE